MKLREFTRSGSFVVIVLVSVIVLMVFLLGEIGEMFNIGFLKFQLGKAFAGWSSGSVPARRGNAVGRTVDWERFRHDLEAFSRWADERQIVGIALPAPKPTPVPVVPDEAKAKRRIWFVPVASCTAGDPMGRKKGYVFIAGFKRIFEEGATIKPTETLCGYEIVCVGERTVWFRAVLEDDEEKGMGVVKLPEFTRVEGEKLVRGNRKYGIRYTFGLTSGGGLMVDSFLPPDGVVFKLLDKNGLEMTSLLCVVISEKGDK